MRRRAALVAVICGVACQDITNPELADVAGEYAATMFRISIPNGPSIDHLEEGARLDMVLHPDQSVTGELFIPGVRNDGTDLTADMAGTWSLNGRTVAFTQTADTFVRDVRFTYTRNSELVVHETMSGALIQIVLARRRDSQRSADSKD